MIAEKGILELVEAANLLKADYRERVRITSYNVCYTKLLRIEELRQYVPNADVYITGSDQVWNYIYNEGIDRSFFLDFVPENKRKYSYAASLGIDQMPETDSKMRNNFV